MGLLGQQVPGEVEKISSAMEHAYEFWNIVERAVVGTGGGSAPSIGGRSMDEKG